LAADLSLEPTSDELHRTIRRFRREQEGYYAIESLLGNSSTMQKLRAQVAAAAASGANTLISGRPGTGRGHVARAIHYHTAGATPAKLVPIDCELVTDDRLRRALDALQSDDGRNRSTLLLENLDRLEASLQSQLLAVLRHNAFRARIVATCRDPPVESELADSEEQLSAAIDPVLVDTVSIINIRMPRLLDRLDDLPILAQCFLEACNRGSGKQVGSLRADALDQLALYGWPGELDELRQVIAAAHRTCKSHDISAADLPSVIYHASQTASRVRKQPQRIVLDELLAQIEREAIVQALAQAGGNKTEAADLLGMTRPRLYRRLVQLGLIADSIDARPEFIEHPPSDEAP
jgi:DNA-binding NtrC family response regulator